ncbi:hydrolase [Planotetraspora silvatica]|uniref:Hydrolase n=1 Tax=Planotetraspora silvatica TaxID=234614 RepID=A0A8J3XQ33_9ACTN|nr:alpha/beta hydrolase [Planotetraspora silvatica]GII44598.1 hydrolase [Planotetraspora silvatica]
MTEYLEIEGGRLAYDVTGEGPLVVLSHGMGDGREAYRLLAPRLVAAGYRVAKADLRGHGESTTGWSSYTRTDTANDLLALIRHLGGPAVVVGHSFSGGAATIAAALHPDLVNAVVQIGPFTRAQKLSLGGLLRNSRHRKGISLLLGAGLLRSVGLWMRYLNLAYPGSRPADYAEYMAALEGALRRPDRMAVVGKMGMSTPSDAGAQLPNLRVPALILMGTLDPDWADPRAEADGVVAGMPVGRGTVVMIEGAGHYAHAQFPGEVAEVMVPFLKEHARA